MSRIIVGASETPFPGSVALTNLITHSKSDLTGWITSGTPTVTTSQITWTAGDGTDRVRNGFYTITAGRRMLAVLRGRAGNLNDNAGAYFTRTSIRYFDGGLGAWQPELGTGITDSGVEVPFRNDGVYRNYFLKYTAGSTGATYLFDLYDNAANSAGRIIQYNYVGLYDIQGLTGWRHDPVNGQIRFNLDKQFSWWGDSTSQYEACYLASWLNIVNYNDKGVGGNSAAQIRARFEAAPETWGHPCIIWSGHNSIGAVSPAAIQADIQAITDILDARGTDYRVLTLIANKLWVTPTTQEYIDREAVNAWILSTYGTKAVDIYAYLRTKGDGGANDNADIAAGILPRSLQADDIHLNGRGKDFVRDKVFESVDVKGWHG